MSYFFGFIAISDQHGHVAGLGNFRIEQISHLRGANLCHRVSVLGATEWLVDIQMPNGQCWYFLTIVQAKAL